MAANSRFLVHLPIAALIGLLGSSVAIALLIRTLAARRGVVLGLTRGKLLSICLLAQVVTVTVAGLLLNMIGGIPAGPLAGPPLVVLVILYGSPLIIVALGFGTVINQMSETGKTHRLGVLSSIIFGVIHLIAIPTVWAIFSILFIIL